MFTLHLISYVTKLHLHEEVHRSKFDLLIKKALCKMWDSNESSLAKIFVNWISRVVTVTLLSDWDFDSHCQMGLDWFEIDFEWIGMNVIGSEWISIRNQGGLSAFQSDKYHCFVNFTWVRLFGSSLLRIFNELSVSCIDGWGSKFCTMKCRMTEISKFPSCEY